MLDILKKTYYRLPPFINRIAYLVPIEYRLGGKTFIETLNFIHKSEKWPSEKLRKYQAHMLKKILNYAVKHIPYYRGIKLSGNAFRDLEKFPIIDKNEIIENIHSFIPKNISKLKVSMDTTGGTSGRQMRFYVDNKAYAKEWAFIISLWQRVGYQLGDKIISIRGGSILFKNSIWREQPIYNAIELSPFHLNPKTLPKYLTIIRHTKPKFIHGYPSAITILAKYIINNNITDLPKTKAILLASEGTYPGQRELIEQAFKTKTFTWYGQSEKVVLAGECEHSKIYHVFPQYGFIELLGKDGSIINQDNPSEEGEIVGTSFITHTMPFIRYRTGDYATWNEEQKCTCNRQYPLIKNIKGRWKQEMVIGKHGSLIPLTAINIHSEELNKVYNYQYYQDTPGILILKVKPFKNFTEKDKRKIKQLFKMRLGDELDIIIQETNEIEYAPGGKIKMLIQKLNTTL